jgi:hypothetical protein
MARKTLLAPSGGVVPHSFDSLSASRSVRIISSHSRGRRPLIGRQSAEFACLFRRSAASANVSNRARRRIRTTVPIISPTRTKSNTRANIWLRVNGVRQDAGSIDPHQLVVAPRPGQAFREPTLFETWPLSFDPPAHRDVSPPIPVVIQLNAAIARNPPGLGTSRPLRVRAEGLDLDQNVSGLLHAWARVSSGEWLCLLSFRVSTGNQRGYLDMKQWCPAESATPDGNSSGLQPNP